LQICHHQKIESNFDEVCSIGQGSHDLVLEVFRG
jgi:hypothetical protein